jgi:hypothetical protein
MSPASRNIGAAFMRFTDAAAAVEAAVSVVNTPARLTRSCTVQPAPSVALTA